MENFGLHFLSGDNAKGRFSDAVLVLGDYRERTRVDLSKWSIDDYLKHWAKCTKLVINGHSVLLCTSYSSDVLTLWPAKRIGPNIILSSFICPASEVIVAGHLMELASGIDSSSDDDDPEISRWVVPIPLTALQV